MSDAQTEPAPGGTEPRPSRVPDRARRAATRGAAVAERGRLWIENQEPASRKGATIGWVRRYQAADGQLYAVLLSAYFFLTMLPVVSRHRELRLQGSDRARPTGSSTGSSCTAPRPPCSRPVMRGAGEHKLSAVLIAIIDLFFFGLGFRPRVPTRPSALVGGSTSGKAVIVDQARYAEVLAAMVPGARSSLCSRSRNSEGEPAWIGWVLDLAWLALLLTFFVWAPRLLLHRRVAASDLLPGALFTVARPRRLAADLRPALHPLVELVFDDLRGIRDRDRDLLLDHPHRDRHGSRRCPLPRARPSPRSARGPSLGAGRPWPGSSSSNGGWRGSSETR